MWLYECLPDNLSLHKEGEIKITPRLLMALDGIDKAVGQEIIMTMSNAADRFSRNSNTSLA